MQRWSNMNKTKEETFNLNNYLPVDGLSRWRQFAQFSPFSREKFRQLVKAGKAPQPVRFSARCTAYSNKELHRFFADPLNYIAEIV